MSAQAEHVHTYEECWICQLVFCFACDSHCPRCGPPEGFGPTEAEEAEQEEARRISYFSRRRKQR